MSTKQRTCVRRAKKEKENVKNKDRMTRKRKRKKQKQNEIRFFNYAFVDDDCSSFASSKDDDDEGVRIIFDRSVVAVVEGDGSFDLKILYPIPAAGLGKRTGRGRRATLVKYGEKFVF